MRSKATKCSGCGRSAKRYPLKGGKCAKCTREYRRRYRASHKRTCPKMPIEGERFDAILRDPPQTRHRCGPFVCTRRRSNYLVEAIDLGKEPAPWRFEYSRWTFDVHV